MFCGNTDLACRTSHARGSFKIVKNNTDSRSFSGSKASTPFVPPNRLPGRSARIADLLSLEFEHPATLHESSMSTIKCRPTGSVGCAAAVRANVAQVRIKTHPTMNARLVLLKMVVSRTAFHVCSACWRMARTRLAPFHPTNSTAIR